MRKFYTFLFTFFAICFTANVSAQTITIGSGTLTQRWPLGHLWGYERTASLYTTAEMSAVAGNNITSLGWYVVGAGTVCPTKIYLKTTTSAPITTNTWANFISGATLVYDASTTPAPANGWYTVPLTTPFPYSGDNLLVLVEMNFTGTGGGTNPTLQYSTSTNNQAYWTSDNTPPAGNATSLNSNRTNIQITYASSSPCSGTPAPGNTVASANPVCPGVNFNLTLQNNTTGSGVTYQWQSANDAAFTVGLTNLGTSSSQSTSQTSNKYYRCLVTCTNSGISVYSNPVYVTTNTPASCYCTPSTAGGATYYISNFTTTGGTTNINNTSGGSATGYQDFFATNIMSVSQTTAFNYSINIAGGSNYGYAIWIDYNQDGTFQPGEQVVTSPGYAYPPITGSITIPGTATLGTTRMRVLASYTPGNPTGPCVNTGSGEYEDYAITILAPPACTAPTAAAATGVTATAATANWTPTSGNWIIEYGPSATFTPVGTGATAGNANNFVATASNVGTLNLAGLTSATNYSYVIRKDCGSGSYSANSSTINFTTLCNATNVPYTQDFESITPPAIPTCTQVVQGGSGNLWQTVSSPGYGFTTKALRYSWNLSNPANTWYFIQGLNLTGGTTYRLKYDYGNTGTTFPEKLKVAYGTSATIAAMTTTLADHPNVVNSTPLTNTVDFTPATTGVYYIGFQAYSNANEFYLFLDNINVTAPPPPNDACTGAIPIACGQTINGSTTNATPDAVTGCATTLNTAPGVWYSMVGDGSPVTMSLCGSSFDTKIGVFTGTCTALTCVASNDDFCGVQSQVTFNTVAGTTYYILVTGFGSSSGAFTLVRNCAPACSGVPSPGSIAPTTTSVCTGTSVTLTVSGYSAATGLTFQWRSAPAAGGPYTNIAGATSNVYTFNATATAYYTCEVTCTNGNGSGTTAAVVVNVSNISHSSLVATPSTVCSPGSVVITATATGGLGNYTHSLTGPGTIGAAVPSGPNNSNVSFTVTNIPAGVQTYTLTSTDGTPCSKSSTVSVTVNPTPVVTLTPAAPVICAGAIQVITASSTPTSTVVFSPVTGLFTDAAATVPYTGTAVNTVYAKPATTTTYTATAVVNGCTGTQNVTITVNQLPAIVTNPAPATQMICPGFNVTYTVSASGAGPLTYQWRRNGVALANSGQIFGATSPTLTIFNVALANAGNYDCVVSGACPPAATSAVAVLQVAAAPTITTQPANATVCTAPSTNLVSATFNVVAAGSPAPNIFQWQISTDGGATWTNLANTPSTSSPFYNNVFSSSLSVANAPVSLNGARFRLIVTNSCGQSITSNAATLTVNAATPATVTDLSTTRVCLSDTLVNLVGTPVGGSWSGIGVSGFNFVPASTGIGTYPLTYTYTNAAGCTAKASTTVAVSDCPERLRLLKDNAVSIYPNPNNGQFNIRINSSLYNYLGMKVFDMNGRLMNGKITKNGIDGQLVSPVWTNLVYGRVIPVNLTGLAAGTYLVELYYDDGIRTEKKGFLIQITK